MPLIGRNNNDAITAMGNDYLGALAWGGKCINGKGKLVG